MQACHAQGISHRDIKPENFIVTSDEKDRKVIVKLSDFGLATLDRFSADVDCGSAPYMSYGTLFFFLYCFFLSLLLLWLCIY